MDWFYAHDGKQLGPVSEADLGQLARSGTVTPDTLVWHAGLTDWQPYRSVGGDAPPPLRFCNSCGNHFAAAELAVFGESAVCADCQPGYVQRLRQGMVSSSGVHVFRYAGFWIRVLAVIIDSIILQIVQYAIFIPAGLSSFTDSRVFESVTAVTAVLVLLFLNIAYYVFFWTRYCATPGKMALGLKVVRPDGELISTGQAIGRYFAQFVDALTIGIGYMMAGWNSEKRALHDMICNTRVIRVR